MKRSMFLRLLLVAPFAIKAMNDSFTKNEEKFKLTHEFVRDLKTAMLEKKIWQQNWRSHYMSFHDFSKKPMTFDGMNK